MPRNFNINIGIYGDEDGPSVQVSGRDTAVITDREMRAFQMTDENLRDGIEAHFNNRPNQVYVKDPTKWGNTYDKFGWEPVERILVARAGRPVINTESVVVAEQTFNNPSSTLTTKCNVGLSQQLQESFTSSWSHSRAFSVEKGIKYDIGFLGNGVGGTAGFTATGTWGEEVSKTKSVTLGLTSGMEVTLAPGQRARTALTARHATLDVIVYYDATLRGDVFGNHNPEHKNHHFWAHDVNDIMEAADLPTSLVVKQKIKVGFYSDVEMTVVDPDEHDDVLATWPRRRPVWM